MYLLSELQTNAQVAQTTNYYVVVCVMVLKLAMQGQAG